MSMKISLLIGLLMQVAACSAQVTCKAGRAIDTPAGDLVISRCVDQNQQPVKRFVSVAGEKVLEATYLSDEDSDKGRMKWVFRGDALRETGCPDRLFFLDLSHKPFRVFSFGVRKACNEFQWSSWGKKRSVIALKNNVAFVYENGKFSLPAAGEKLWSSIEPPHAGSGMTIEDVVPFAEELALP